MEDDEIIIINHNTSNNNQKKTSKKNSKKKKAVKKTASKNNAKKDKTKVKALNRVNRNNQAPNVIKIVGICSILILSIILLLTSDLFNIEKIEVIGNSKLSSEQIISLSRIQKETNIFKINKRKTKTKLKEEAYIESAEIKLKFPNTVEIHIKERIPKFMLQFADSFVYINSQGYMLEIANDPLEIPILIGTVTDLSNIHPGNRMDVGDLKKLEKVIKLIEIAKANDIANLITKVDISDESNYTLILDGEGKKAYLGDCTELNTRILLLKKILEVEKGNSGEVFLNVDLNTTNAYFRESVNI